MTALVSDACGMYAPQQKSSLQSVEFVVGASNLAHAQFGIYPTQHDGVHAKGHSTADHRGLTVGLQHVAHGGRAQRGKRVDVGNRAARAGFDHAQAGLALGGSDQQLVQPVFVVGLDACQHDVGAKTLHGHGSLSGGNQALVQFVQRGNAYDQHRKAIRELVQALGIARYSMYVMDYGAPVGYRLALLHPERVQALIIQNGNAYEEGLLQFWDPIKRYWADPTPENRAALHFLVDLKSTRWQYEDGVPDTSLVDPTTWVVDQAGLDRPGNLDIQMDLFLSYGTNVPLYPEFQAFFRKYQPPTLITWGKNDFIFPVEGALAFKRDLPNAEIRLLNTGHFALETDGIRIARLIREFLAKQHLGN